MIKKILAPFLLLLIGVVVAHSQSQKIVADKIVAVVGDGIILQSDIDNSLATAKTQGMDIADGAGCLFIRQAVTSKVFALQAKKDSLPVTDEDVEAELDQKIRYHIKILGGREKLEDYIGKTIYQLKEDAREVVKENRLAAAMQQKIVNSIRVTPAEVIAFFDRIPKDSLPFIESKFEVGRITITPEPSAAWEKYIVAELNNYKRQLENKTATFEQLVVRYSEHLESKRQEGSYRVNRNETSLDPAIVLASFRLKNGEISAPLKSPKAEYFLIQMINRKGDDADIRIIMRTTPATDVEVSQAKEKLDTIRSKIVAGDIEFNAAADKYSDDQTQKFSGPFLLNQDGSPYITISQMDNELVAQLSKMKVGEISAPISFAADQTRKAVQLIYLKSRSEPHRLNFKDDYAEIAQAALDEKKELTLTRWVISKMATCYIMIDDKLKTGCPELKEYANAGMKGF